MRPRSRTPLLPIWRNWTHDEVQIDRRCSPPDEHRRSPTDEEDVGLARGLACKGRQECFDACSIRYLAHAAAR